MVITNVILFLSIVNFILTLFVFLNARKSKQHISFLIFSLITTIWLFDNFISRISSGIYTQLSYGLGIFVATSALIWVYYLINSRPPSFVFYFLIPLSIIVFFIATFSNYVTSPAFSVKPLGYEGEKGVLFVEYFLYLSVLIGMSLFKLLKASLKESNPLKKQQVFSIFIGAFLSGFLALTANFVIPLFFDTFDFADLVTISFFPLTMFIIYSMMKQQLFGIKIMATQFLVVLFLSLLLLNLLLSASFEQYIWNGIIFIISASLSYLIVKSMFSEIEIEKKLLKETQKNLDLEKRISNTFAEIADKRIKRIEDKIFSERK